MTDLDDSVDTADTAQLLRAAAVAHGARTEISAAAAELAARPLDEAAAEQLRTLLGHRAEAGRAAAARLTSSRRASSEAGPAAHDAGQPHLRLLPTRPGDPDSGGTPRPQVAPPAGRGSRRPTSSSTGTTVGPAAAAAPVAGGGAA